MSGLQSTISGRTVKGLKVKGVFEQTTYNLPCLYENNFIPESTEEVATPEALNKNPSLKKFPHHFTEMDRKAEVMMLIGRDSGELMTTEIENRGFPVIHKTPLGWTCVGEICPVKSSEKNKFVTLRTGMCEHFEMKRQFDDQSIFSKSADDELDSFSSEDKQFCEIIENNCHINDEGHLEMPLPFRCDNKVMPNNKFAVFHRQKSTLSKLKHSEEKLEASLKCMQAFMKGGHVEQIPEHEQNGPAGRTWFLPVFPVIQEKKNKLRLVFDGAAAYGGISFNSCLLSGPDQNNKLRGVLIRFRVSWICF